MDELALSGPSATMDRMTKPNSAKLLATLIARQAESDAGRARNTYIFSSLGLLEEAKQDASWSMTVAALSSLGRLEKDYLPPPHPAPEIPPPPVPDLVVVSPH